MRDNHYWLVNFEIISLALIALQKLDPFDFDGVAVSAQGDCSWEGLVQRVPKKENEVKADLQNSTASQGDNHL